MITEKEQAATLLSPTKKDYYQIWNELLETASKISNRWDPTSTNESDPGIVLLKLLTAVADKLNYNIDKNTLEAFMPSATQEESMKKLCDMMGYNMKYYQSAVTSVNIGYTGNLFNPEEESSVETIVLPQFSNISNEDNTVNYVTLKPVMFLRAENERVKPVDVLEGQIVKCEAENNNIITIEAIDDNYRYYLPETMIAENGIFIYNWSNGGRSEAWTKVDNLNTRSIDEKNHFAKVYKFNIDSRLHVPYIQFPDDISSIIEDGLEIYYTRTNGVNGNTSARTLTKIDVSVAEVSDGTSEPPTVAETDFSVVNPNAALSGRDKESIDEAYNNYKKVIGTFDTLVTCRDYMNKIYQLTKSENDTTPLVSNIIAADIRDDINKAITLCSFDEYGINYIEKSITSADTDLINHFDLLLYPFKTVFGLNSPFKEDTIINTKEEYKSSFQIDNGAVRKEILAGIKDNKCISHSVKYPEANDIACIKNYLRLNARITTTRKINIVEEKALLATIKQAIYKKFNSRNLDFGEEIPFDSILSCIENADPLIKNVSLDEPILHTVFMTGDNNEYSIDSTDGPTALKAKQLYNKLALRNILAGRVALFNYDTAFKYNYNEQALTGQSTIYPTDSNKISKIVSHFDLGSEYFSTPTHSEYKLKPNEVVQFRMPNLKTSVTYPAYVNYYLHLANAEEALGYPATFITLAEFFWKDDNSYLGVGASVSTLQQKHRKQLIEDALNLEGASYTEDDFNKRKNGGSRFYYKNGNNYIEANNYDSSKAYYEVIITRENFAGFVSYIQQITINSVKLSGLYRIQIYGKVTRAPGYLVDANHNIYNLYTQWQGGISGDPFNVFWVQQTHSAAEAASRGLTIDGLGKDLILSGLPANGDYKLQEGDYLAINYTPSSSDDNTPALPQNIIIKDKIIRPNFLLSDSTNYYTSGHNYDKTSGFDFSNYTESVPGMFAFGPNEQVEIREPVKVQIGNDAQNIATYYFYWMLNTKNDNLEIPFETVGTGTTAYKTYTLKEGEYIFYTNKYKTDMAWYGNGTEIKCLGTNAAEIRFTRSEAEEVSLEKIMSYGISAIPWQAISLSGQPNNSKYIEFQEYQYITLTENDSILSLKNSLEENIGLSNTWVDVATATYRLGDEAKSLPAVNIPEVSWKVRSRLDFNCGPNLVQDLNRDGRVIQTGTDLNVQYSCDYLQVYYNDSTTPSEVIYPIVAPTISLKTNYLCNVAADTLYPSVLTEISEAEESETSIAPFKIKIFKQVPVVSKDGTGQNEAALDLHNFNSNWTAVEFTDKLKQFELQTAIPEGSMGLMMIYYNIDSEPSLTENACVYLYDYDTAGHAGTVPALGIMNIDSAIDEYHWWPDSATGTGAAARFYLKPGINIIKIPELNNFPEAVLRIEADHKLSQSTSTVIFSDLDVVVVGSDDDATYGINLETLNYYYDDTLPREATLKERVQSLLYDLRVIDPDHTFYYNNLSDSSTLIDINTVARDSKGKLLETLGSPRIWYDYNNLNNKFVISEIDADFLDNGGIILTNSSKL